MTFAADNVVTRVQVSYYLATGSSLGATSFHPALTLADAGVYLGSGYTYAGAQYVQQARTRVEIDLNVRVRGNDTFVGFDDVSGPIAVGESVEVYESESGVSGDGRITEIDSDRQLVYLSVDWASLTEGGSSSSNVETSTATLSTRLLFPGESFADTTYLHGSWTGMVPSPSLIDVAGVDSSIWITAPIYDSCGWLPGGLVEPYIEMQQNVLFRTSLVVAA